MKFYYTFLNRNTWIIVIERDENMGNYLQSGLGKDEVIINVAKISLIILVPHIILAAILTLGAFTGGLGAVFLMWLFVVIIALPRIITFFFTELGFTNKKVLGKQGFIKTKVMESPLSQINNVSVSNGLFGKLFGYGTVQINTASGSYTFKTISDPNGFRSALMNQVEQFGEDKIKRQAEEMARAMKE